MASSTEVINQIRANGGARTFDQQVFLANRIVAEIVSTASCESIGTRTPADAIEELTANIDAIYEGSRGFLTGTQRQTIEACYAKIAQLKAEMRSEYLEEPEETIPCRPHLSAPKTPSVKSATDTLEALTDDEYARYVRDLQGCTS